MRKRTRSTLSIGGDSVGDDNILITHPLSKHIKTVGYTLQFDSIQDENHSLVSRNGNFTGIIASRAGFMSSVLLLWLSRRNTLQTILICTFYRDETHRPDTQTICSKKEETMRIQCNLRDIIQGMRQFEGSHFKRSCYLHVASLDCRDTHRSQTSEKSAEPSDDQQQQHYETQEEDEIFKFALARCLYYHYHIVKNNTQSSQDGDDAMRLNNVISQLYDIEHPQYVWNVPTLPNIIELCKSEIFSRLSDACDSHCCSVLRAMLLHASRNRIQTLYLAFDMFSKCFPGILQHIVSDRMNDIFPKNPRTNTIEMDIELPIVYFTQNNCGDDDVDGDENETFQHTLPNMSLYRVRIVVPCVTQDTKSALQFINTLYEERDQVQTQLEQQLMQSNEFHSHEDFKLFTHLPFDENYDFLSFLDSSMLWYSNEERKQFLYTNTTCC